MSPSDTRRLCVPGTDDGIRTVLDALEAFAAGHGLSKAVTWPVEVSLDEVLANVVGTGSLGAERRPPSRWSCGSTSTPIPRCARWW